MAVIHGLSSGLRYLAKFWSVGVWWVCGGCLENCPETPLFVLLMLAHRVRARKAPSFLEEVNCVCGV